MSVNEQAAAQQYLLDYLTADATLVAMLEGGVWTDTIGQSVRFPVVKVVKQDAADLMVVGLHRVWADLTFLVRGIVHWTGSGHPDWTTVREIADRIDTLLHDHEETTAELEVHSFREEAFVDETLEPDLFLHAGGFYRVRARAV